MDWIERLFHIAPDGGDGSLEIGITVGIVVAVLIALTGAARLLSIVRRWRDTLRASTPPTAPHSLDRSDG